MDQFVVLATLSDNILADVVCSALESAGIPVLMEHVEIVQGHLNASGVRVLAPADKAQHAMLLVQHVLDLQSRPVSDTSFLNH